MMALPLFWPYPIRFADKTRFYVRGGDCCGRADGDAKPFSPKNKKFFPGEKMEVTARVRAQQ